MSNNLKFCYKCSETFETYPANHRDLEHDGEYAAYDFASRIASFARQRQESFWDSWVQA